MMKRRQLLKLAGAGAVGSAFGTLPSLAPAQTKPDQVVVMTWGGLWGDAMRDNVDAAFQKSTGIKVVQDRSSSPVERITKLKVSLNDQKVDLVQIHDGLVPLAIKQGVVEKLNKDSPRMANVRNMIPQFWNDYWVPMIFSAIGVTYNTKLVKNPPTSFADLWRPEFKGRIVLPEVSHSIGTYIIPIGAMAAGKDPKDEAAGFEMLKKMADLRPIWAKDTDSIMNALRDEEAVIGLLYKSQTYTVKGWNTPVEWVYPKEGGIPYISGTSIAKNTKNLEAAERYLDVTMDPDVQPFVTKVFNYPGTNKDMLSRLSPELKERAQFTQAQLDKLVTLDHEFMSDKRADWTQRWNRVVAGG
jgi:spermidine/putrescine-binding protein